MFAGLLQVSVNIQANRAMTDKQRIRSWEITSETNFLNRRRFLQDAGLLIGAASVSAALPGLARADVRELE